jgi:hypothetical protein
MFIYEVNLEIDKSIEQAFREWLTPHAEEVIATGKFTHFKIIETAAPAEKFRLSVQYFAKTQSDIDEYIAKDAPRLREDGQKKFGGKFTATRRIFNEDYYFNEEGLMVFTAGYLRKQGECCNSGCRNCPY